MYNFFTSIEFYVIACVVAAAIVIISAMPKRVGEARQFLLAGYLCFDDDPDHEGDQDKSIKTENDNTNQGSVSTTFTGEPSIVEVRVDGYREIPLNNTGAKVLAKNKRNLSSGQNPNQNTPRWINGTAEGVEPEIDLLCLDDGTVKLIRKGLNGVITADGAVSLACTLIGFDLQIEERLVYGGRKTNEPVPTEAVFTLDFLALNEHYHIRYNSDTIHRMTAFTLATKPDMHIVRPLT